MRFKIVTLMVRNSLDLMSVPVYLRMLVLKVLILEARVLVYIVRNIRMWILRAPICEGASFYSPQFVNCKFDHAKLNCVDFRASNFIDCFFSGKLKSIWFNKYYRFPGDEEEYGKAPVNEMLNVDFSDAILWNVMFTGGVDLSSVKLPSDNTHLLVKRSGLALSKISFDDVPESQREELAFRTRMYAITARRQPMYILNKAEIIKRMGKELGEVFISKLIDADKNLL